MGIGERGPMVAILVGGGPAPGINSVIGAATIRSILGGCEVIGIQDGFKWIMAGNRDKIKRLTIEDISRIHFSGGSCLGTARANPTQKPEYLDACLASLDALGVTKLITIGGDDTAFSALRLEQRAQGRLQVVHVPKTID
ncbi:MAG TPA: 6-phosphofructokinase, partial [Nitrospira sp.]|nr:6-phosphofructokinase [Nitrospira sp.]